MAVSTRHIRRGTMRLLWVPAIADADAPTVAELDAGDDLSQFVVQANGFGVTRGTVPLPVADGYGTQLSVPADPVIAEAPRLTMYDEGTGTAAVRTALAVDAVGFVVICLDGPPTGGDRAQVWPVVSCGPVDQVIADVAAAEFTVAFATTAAPTLDATVAA